MTAQIMTITLIICCASMIRSETHKLCPVSQPIQSQLNILKVEGEILKRNIFGTFNGSVSNTSNVNFSFLTSNIQVINIIHIPIKEIEDDIFFHFVCLSHLNLSYNVISNISSKTFGNLTELKALNLSMNFIQNISVQAFSGLKSLESLDLSFNRISAINKLQFVHNVQLEHLNLSHNLIKSLSNSFYPLIQLKQLLLNDCSIAQFYTFWMRNNTVLETLDISSNQMVGLYVELHSFNKTSMQLWNFSNNCLSRLPFDKISLEFSNSATIIDLSNNLFNCSKWPEHLNYFKRHNINLAPMRNTSGQKIKTWNCFIENLPTNTNVFVPSFIIVCFIIVSMFLVLFVIDYRAKLGYRERIIEKIRKCFFDKPLQRAGSYNHLQVDF